jgi:2-methylcitrate dehydratase PrpD
MLTQRLAEFVVGTRAGDIPAEVMHGARDALIDTLGVALAGSLEDVGEIALAYTGELGGKPEAHVWGTHFRTTSLDAAFVNGIFSHALDFDDTHPNVRGHPSTTMVPVALAMAERTGATGEAVLAALAVGLEVGGKMGRALGDGHYLRGWHSTATTGVFASTAVAARLLGFDADRLCQAFGIAASQAAGLLRNFGTMTKPFHAGHAARCAVQAALLARAGMTADAGIFDGKTSFLATYGGEDAQPLAGLLDQLAQPWEMITPGNCVKRWPCCYCNHRSIGVLLQMIAQHGIRAGDVEAIEIGFPPGTDNALVSSDPRTGLAGKFSIEYVAAATVLDGKVGIDTFTDVMVNRPQVRALMQKVRRYRVEDDKVYSGSVGYNDVLVRTKQGEHSVRIDRTPGSAQWPITEADRDEKFLDCAGRVLGNVGARRVLELAVRCAKLPDLRELAAAMVPDAAVRAGRSGAAAPLVSR